jgi:hypothetical protein
VLLPDGLTCTSHGFYRQHSTHISIVQTSNTFADF